MIQEEYKGTVRACSVRKAKTHLEYNLVRDLKGNKKGLCRHISIKRNGSENAGVLLNGTEELVTKDMERPRYLMPSLLLSLLIIFSFKNLRLLRPVGSLEQESLTLSGGGSS